MKPRIVLAYRGDFDTTAAISWLAETYDADIVTITLDVGQRRDPAETRDRALAAGAVRAHVFDVREDFARQSVLPALQRAALHGTPEDPQPLPALTAPLVARMLVEMADIEGATAVAHGSSSTAIDEAVTALRAGMVVMAPARDWHATADERREWARRRGLPAPAPGEDACRIAESLWGRVLSFAPDTLDASGVSAATAPATVRATIADDVHVELRFEGATPVAVNGVTMPVSELLEIVSVIAGEQGIGRVERLEADASGALRRTVYDAPAAAVLQTAYAHRGPDGTTVRLKLAAGRPTVVSELVNHA